MLFQVLFCFNEEILVSQMTCCQQLGYVVSFGSGLPA